MRRYPRTSRNLVVVVLIAVLIALTFLWTWAALVVVGLGWAASLVVDFRRDRRETRRRDAAETLNENRRMMGFRRKG